MTDSDTKIAPKEPISQGGDSQQQPLRPLKARYRTITGLNARAKSLAKGSFAGSEFITADFRDADLRQADFRGCRFVDCQFDAAILEEARMNGAQLLNCSLKSISGKGLIADDLRAQSCDFSGATFAAGSLRNAQFWRCVLIDVSFEASVLNGVTTYECTLDPEIREQTFRGEPRFKGLMKGRYQGLRVVAVIAVVLAILGSGYLIRYRRMDPSRWNFLTFINRLEETKTKGNYERVLRYCEIGKKRFAHDNQKVARFLLFESEAHKAVERYDEAYESIKSALAIANNDYGILIPAHYAVYDLFVRQQKYDELLAAMEEFNVAIENIEHKYWFARAKAEVYKLKRDFDSARTQYQWMLKEFAASEVRVQETQKMLAQLELQAGSGERAHDIIQDLVRSQGSYLEKVNLISELIRTELTHNKLEEAEKIYQENKEFLFSQATDNVGYIFINIADQFRAKDRCDTAHEIYDKVLATSKLETVLATAFRGKANTFMQLGNFEEAQKILEKISIDYRHLATEVEEAKTLLASMLRNMGKREESITQFQELVKITKDPIRENWALDNIAQMLIENNNLDEAEQMYRESLKRGGQRGDKWIKNSALMNLSHLALRRNNRDQAIEYLNQIVKDPADSGQKAQAMRRIAELNADDNKVDQAIAIYRDIEKTFENEPVLAAEASFGRAMMLRRQGKRDEAFDVYLDISNRGLGPDQTARSLEGQAHILIEKREYAKAEVLYQEILKRYETDIGIRFMGRSGLANLYRATERKPEALEQYEVILTDIRERGLRSWTLMAASEVLTELGRLDEAKQYLQTIVTDYPGMHHAQEAKNRLARMATETPQAPIP